MIEKEETAARKSMSEMAAVEARGCWRLAVLALAGALACGGCTAVARLMMRVVLR